MLILGVSGSLRSGSSNTAALEALRALAPAGITVRLYAGLADLPHFNPDLEAGTLPGAVAALRASVAEADALVISSPEYARGVPGSLKNALDWLVGGPEFPGKPVALVNTSPRATHAQASLALTLQTMSAVLVEQASVTLPLLGRSWTAAEIVADPALAAALRTSLADLLVNAAIGRPAVTSTPSPS